MTRFLFRVQYTDREGAVSYEPVCVRANDETAARVEVATATNRYRALSGATTTVTLIGTAADA